MRSLGIVCAALTLIVCAPLGRGAPAADARTAATAATTATAGWGPGRRRRRRRRVHDPLP